MPLQIMGVSEPFMCRRCRILSEDTVGVDVVLFFLFSEYHHADGAYATLRCPTIEDRKIYESCGRSPFRHCCRPALLGDPRSPYRGIGGRRRESQALLSVGVSASTLDNGVDTTDGIGRSFRSNDSSVSFEYDRECPSDVH